MMSAPVSPHLDPVRAVTALKWIRESVRVGLVGRVGHLICLNTPLSATHTWWGCNHADLDRLERILDTGGVPQHPNGQYYGILGVCDVLIVPCSNSDQPFPRKTRVHPSVWTEKDGSMYSETDGGSWHLFSLVPPGNDTPIFDSSITEN